MIGRVDQHDPEYSTVCASNVPEILGWTQQKVAAKTILRNSPFCPEINLYSFGWRINNEYTWISKLYSTYGI